MFRFFRTRLSVSPAGLPATAARPPASSRPLDPDNPPVATIDDWFLRTTRRLLKGPRSNAEPDGKRKSPQEQRLDALEQKHAALQAENERLAGEVVALRTMLYSRRHGR